MRQRVAAGLFVVAFAMAGVAAGHGNAVEDRVESKGCQLLIEGAPPEAGRGDGEEPPLMVTKEASGLVKGHVFTPAAFLMAKSTCPEAGMWESWQGSQHLDGVEFSASDLAKVHVYDGDPMGLRTWRGPQGVESQPVDVDIRLGTDIQPIASIPQDDGGVEATYVVLRYSPEAKGLVPYGGVGVTVEKRCGEKWSELAKTGTDGERGEFTVAVPAGECAEELRATADDSDDTWGRPIVLTK